MNKRQTNAYKKRLTNLRSETEADSASSEGARRPVELDQQMVGRLSRMDALQGQAMSLEVERRRTVLVQRIDAALARIDEGEFGYCLVCGDDIETARLELDPTTPTCVGCAESG